MKKAFLRNLTVAFSKKHNSLEQNTPRGESEISRMNEEIRVAAPLHEILNKLNEAPLNAEHYLINRLRLNEHEQNYVNKRRISVCFRVKQERLIDQIDLNMALSVRKCSQDSGVEHRKTKQI